MDVTDAAFDPPPSPYCLQCECDEQDLATDAALPLGAASRQVADGYVSPLSTHARLRRTRCGDGGVLPLAVQAFLTLVCIAAAAWNAWMATGYALEAGRLSNKTASSCLRPPSSGGLSHIVPSDGQPYASARLADGGACMIDAVKLLQQASQVGSNTTLAITSGATSQQRAANDDGTVRSKELQRAARVLAHLGSDQFGLETELSSTHVDRWLDNSGSGFIVSDKIWNAGGGVTIGESGYYFVYSKVHFVLAACDAMEVSAFTDHKLMRRRAGGNQGGDRDSRKTDLLVRAQKTRCWNRELNLTISSSFVGAVFRLDKGDVVTLDVDRVRYVWHTPEKTYIGAYLLSS